MSYLKSRGFRSRKPEKEGAHVSGPNAFQEQGQRLADRVASHPYFIIGSVALVIAVVVVSILVSGWVRDARSAKAVLLADALALWEEGPKGDETGAADHLKRAVAKFGEAAEKTDGTFLGDVALFYKAKGHYRLKEFDTALSLFRRLQDSSRIPAEVRFGAYEGEAYCHIDRGDVAEAAKVWERYAALSGVTLYKDFALYYAGLSYEKLKDAGKAMEFFKKLKAEFPESPLLGKIADRLPEDKKDS